MDTDKVLIVSEGYCTTGGGFLESLRGTLKDLRDTCSRNTYVTSITKYARLPNETKAEIDQLGITIIEPDRKIAEPSQELLTKYHRDYFSRQIVSIPDVRVVVGTQPCTALTANCLRDELTEAYSIKHGSSRLSRPSTSKGKSSSVSSSRGKASSSGKSSKSSGVSSGSHDDENEVKYVIVNYSEGLDELSDHDLPGTSELEFIENARDADVVIAVGLRVYNYWQQILHRENIVHEPLIPFTPILSESHNVEPSHESSASATRRILTLSIGCDILQSDFHQKVAGILGSIAQMKADQYDPNFFTWIVQTEYGLSEQTKRDIRAALAKWSSCKALKIQLISPESRIQLEHHVAISSFILMPGMFTNQGYSGLECMMSSIPCLVPELSDVGDVIRLEDALNTAFLLPPLEQNGEKDWKKRILSVLNNPADAYKHAADLSRRLRHSALFERSKRLLAKEIYAVQTKDEENNGTLETSITENSDSPTHLQNPPDEQGLQIDMDQVQLGDAILGRGSFSIVHSGTYKDEPIAVKTINTGSLTITPQDALRSVSILAKLQHENIVKLIGYALEEQRLHILMELTAQSMDACIATHQLNDFAEDLKFRVAMQCCAGLHHLHARFIVHQDIKPANILLTERMTAKIADFDIARIKRQMHGPTTMTTKHVNKQPGSPYYQPPEVYVERAHFWSDVWSMGGTLVEWFTFEPLWTIPAGQNDLLKVPEYIGKGVQPHGVKNLNPRVHPLLAPCLSHDKHERPTAEEMQTAFQARLHGTEFAGYKQKKTARKAKTLSPLDIMRPAVPVLTAAILFGIGLFKVPLEPLPIEVTVAAVTLLTVCLLAYSSMIDVGWPVIAAVLVMFVVVLVTSMKLHSVMNSQKTNEIPGVSDDDPIVTDDVQTSLTEPPSEMASSIPAFPDLPPDGLSAGEPDSVENDPVPLPSGSSDEPTSPDEQSATSSDQIAPSSSQSIVPDSTQPTAPEPEPELSLSQRFPTVPVAETPEDAEKVLSANGHNKNTMDMEYEGKVIYKNHLLTYRLDGEIKWRGLKTKFKWRCTLWGDGVNVDSDWFLGRASSLTDALRKVPW